MTTVAPWLRWLEVLAWTAFFAFAIVFLALRYWVLPNVERYREDIVAALSRSIGLPVKIGALATDWQGLRPRLSMGDVRIYDRDGREALVLPAVENVVAWRSLLVMDLRLHSFVIDGPKLSIHRDAGGAITVGGIRLAEDRNDGGLTDWILGQSEIVVRDAEIEWRDEYRRAPPLLLSALNLRLRNDGDEHSIGLSARPPRQLGPGLELRAELVGRSVKQLAAWNGRVYAELGYTDLAGWRPWVDYPLDVRRGEGALRVWATLGGGKVTQATADVAATDVVARLGKDLPLLEVASVRGRLHGRETARGYEFGVRNLALASARAPAMKATSFRALWEPAEGTRPQLGSVSANLVELGPLVHLAEFLPFPADLRKLLAELAPQGNLLDLKFEWTGELPDAAVFSAKTRFAGLGMHAWRSIPGFAGLSGSLEASEKKGALYLASRKAELDLPKVFPEPRIQLDTLNGEVGWERMAGNSLAVRLANISFANADLAGTAFGTYAYGGEGPGVIDLSAQISRATGRNTPKYLPLSAIMGKATRDWLAGAILEGRSSDARFRLKGDLRDFPYADPSKGQFLVAARVSGGVLDYASGWPRIEAIEADLMFERDKMEIVGRSGTILGVKIAGVRASFPSLLADETHLIVDGSAEGSTAEFLRYIQSSPVRGMIEGFTDGMKAQGPGKLRLRLDLPLGDLARSKVAGDYQFSANTVTLDPRLPPIERAAGRVSFTETALTVHDGRGQLFGGPVAISGGSRSETGVAIVARGRATVEGIRALFDHPWRRRLAGATPYTATVTAKEGRTRLSFESTLDGISSTLPPPFAKAAGDALPLRVDVYPGEGRDRVSVALGRVAAGEFLRAVQGEAMALQRAVVTLNPVPGEAPRLPERRGMVIRGTLPALDLDRWLPLFSDEAGGGGGTSFDLKISALDALGKRMKEVTLRGLTEGAGWSASVNAGEFAGDLVYRAEGSGRLIARFTHFTLPEDTPGARKGTAGAEP
ncbi:MAG: YhdP family protein, partial [Burkholderiales bacterium]